jgi:hypothetical protein
MVALREDPAVPAGDRPELDEGEAPEALVEGRVPLEGDAVGDRPAQAKGLRRRSVRAVGADDHLGVDFARVEFRAVAKLRAGGDRLLGEVRVEPPPLRHQDERPALSRAVEARVPAEPERHPVDFVLDHRRGVDRQLPHCAKRQPAAARLVARERRLVDEQHSLARAGQMDGGDRPRRAGSDHGDVVSRHASRVLHPIADSRRARPRSIWLAWRPSPRRLQVGPPLRGGCRWPSCRSRERECRSLSPLTTRPRPSSKSSAGLTGCRSTRRSSSSTTGRPTKRRLLLTAWQESRERAQVITQPNRGKGAAIRAAIPHIDGDIVVIQDADMEYDPADVPRLIGPITEGVADVVFGSRLSGGQPQRVHMFWHLVGNRVLSLLTNMLFNTTLSDMETGYKVFRAEVLRSLTLRQNDFGIEPEIAAQVCKRKLRIYELPIAYYGRTHDEGKKITWRDGVIAVKVLVAERLRP